MAWRYDKMRDDRAMQISVGVILPRTARPVQLSAAGLGGYARYYGRATVHRRMARLGDDTRTRLGL